MSELPKAPASSKQSARRFPTGQVARYLIVGVWNTLFGYGLFALLSFVGHRQYSFAVKKPTESP